MPPFHAQCPLSAKSNLPARRSTTGRELTIPFSAMSRPSSKDGLAALPLPTEYPLSQRACRSPATCRNLYDAAVRYFPDSKYAAGSAHGSLLGSPKIRTAKHPDPRSGSIFFPAGLAILLSGVGASSGDRNHWCDKQKCSASVVRLTGTRPGYAANLRVLGIMRKACFGIVCSALLLGGCSESWEGFVYPEKSNLDKYMSIGSYKSLGECRASAIAALQQMSSLERGDYECGLNCKADKDLGGIKVCKETLR